jgi:hypothetical protein
MVLGFFPLLKPSYSFLWEEGLFPSPSPFSADQVPSEECPQIYWRSLSIKTNTQIYKYNFCQSSITSSDFIKNLGVFLDF